MRAGAKCDAEGGAGLGLVDARDTRPRRGMSRPRTVGPQVGGLNRPFWPQERGFGLDQARSSAKRPKSGTQRGTGGDRSGLTRGS
jgi:hypothetical protein